LPKSLAPLSIASAASSSYMHADAQAHDRSAGARGERVLSSVSPQGREARVVAIERKGARARVAEDSRAASGGQMAHGAWRIRRACASCGGTHLVARNHFLLREHLHGKIVGGVLEPHEIHLSDIALPDELDTLEVLRACIRSRGVKPGAWTQRTGRDAHRRG